MFILWISNAGRKDERILGWMHMTAMNWARPNHEPRFCNQSPWWSWKLCCPNKAVRTCSMPGGVRSLSITKEQKSRGRDRKCLWSCCERLLRKGNTCMALFYHSFSLWLRSSTSFQTNIRKTS